MDAKNRKATARESSSLVNTMAAAKGQGQIIAATDGNQCLDAVQLDWLEQSFREWAVAAVRVDVLQSRRRILLIFLLIRSTGAKLNEVLALDPFEDIDVGRQVVFFGRDGSCEEEEPREVHIPEDLCREIRTALIDPRFRESLQKHFHVDPAFVRRKFYERAMASGFDKRLGGPEMIRKARAVELMRGNMPLQAVQKLLGHSTPNLTSAYASFSEGEIKELTRFYMEREAARKTSARNAFFGKIATIRQGDIQSLVELATIGGHAITVIITNDSLRALGLQEGRLATAEVKAPWVILHKGDKEPLSSAENRYRGVIVRRVRGAINTEYVVRLADGTELCSISSTSFEQGLDFEEGEKVWALFNSFSVVLHVE